jgi:hypothetical protein
MSNHPATYGNAAASNVVRRPRESASAPPSNAPTGFDITPNAAETVIINFKIYVQDAVKYVSKQLIFHSIDSAV